MLDVLVLSRPPSWRMRYLRAGSVSVAAHGAALALMVLATGHGAVTRELLIFDTTLVYIAPDRPAEPKDEPARQTERTVLIVDAPVKGFQTIAAIAEIPTELPPIDLTERFDPRDYSGVGVEGGVAEGREMDVAPGTVVHYSPVYLDRVVEEKPVLVASAIPEYPPLLRAAGIEGRVMLEFVVDPQGNVETGTVRVATAGHPEFAAAARAVVPSLRFRPGRMSGRGVRVLVRMPIDFRLT